MTVVLQFGSCEFMYESKEDFNVLFNGENPEQIDLIQKVNEFGSVVREIPVSFSSKVDQTKQFSSILGSGIGKKNHDKNKPIYYTYFKKK